MRLGKGRIEEVTSMPVAKIDAKITLTPTQIGELVKAANAPSPTIFEKIAMRGFKVSGEDVRKLSDPFLIALKASAPSGRSPAATLPSSRP